jgi:hypothetical protein
MADLEPKFNSRISFEIGQVLPANDQLAQWVVNIGRAVNDLLIANRRLDAGMADGTHPHEHLYDIKAIAAHAWELAKFLRKSEADSEEVRSFLTISLPEEALHDYRAALAALDVPEEAASEQDRSFKRHLASARDQATHYSRLDHKLLCAAIERIGDQEGVALFGESFKDFYADFSADLDAQMFFAMKQDRRPFEHFATTLNEVVQSLVRFGVSAVRSYLGDRRSAVVVTPIE